MTDISRRDFISFKFSKEVQDKGDVVPQVLVDMFGKILAEKNPNIRQNHLDRLEIIEKAISEIRAFYYKKR